MGPNYLLICLSDASTITRKMLQQRRALLNWVDRNEKVHTYKLQERCQRNQRYYCLINTFLVLVSHL